jgi:hypothetical protein
MTEEFEKEKPDRLSGKDATHAAMDAAKYPPVKIEECEEPGEQANGLGSEAERLPALADQPNAPEVRRKAPPRVRKPPAMNDRLLAPTADLQSYHARLREAFGNTMSDEFVQVMLGKLVEALKPNPYDQLQETTLNAALAMVGSAECRSELEAFLVVEIVATGFSGLRFLRQSQKHMTEDYINIYGNYANKLIRLQLDLMKALEQMRRVSRQTVAVGRVDIHPGGQALVGIVNRTEERDRIPAGQK